MPRMGEVATSIINTLLPSYVSGEQEAFWQVGGLAAEAVHYFDGDGGSIFVDHFPGLIRYLRVKGIPIHSVSTPRCNPVYFREVFHDAIEQGHQYTIPPVEDTDSLPGESNARPQVKMFGHLSWCMPGTRLAGRRVDVCCLSLTRFTMGLTVIASLLSSIPATRRLISLCRLM